MTQLEPGERPEHDDRRPRRILSLEEMQALLDGADSERYRCLLELLLQPLCGRAEASPSNNRTY